MSATTPRRITQVIQDLAVELTGSSALEYVPVRPTPGADSLYCFPVVERHIEAHGGAICYGWRFWELEWLYVEAEFHAVWRDESGSLVDLTPAPGRVSRILFVVDPEREYEGRQVNNVRRALSNEPAVHDFFDAADAEYALLNRGERSEQHLVELSPAEARELKAISVRKSAAAERMLRSRPQPGRNDQCPCGSNVKYKKCCGA